MAKETKQPLYKRWWFWLVAVIIIGSWFVDVDNNEPVDDTPEENTKEKDGEDSRDDEVESSSENKEVERDEEIELSVKDIVNGDLDSTEINELKVNENMGSDDGSYIVLPHLIWDVKNKKETTKEMIEMYSDHLAATLADQDDISELTVFWEVPYHAEDDNIAKFMYEREGDEMAKVDNWYDAVLK